ncbi:hypothetical protein MHBO_003669, partial [Bonamia ostreae]
MASISSFKKKANGYVVKLDSLTDSSFETSILFTEYSIPTNKLKIYNLAKSLRNEQNATKPQIQDIFSKKLEKILTDFDQNLGDPNLENRKLVKNETKTVLKTVLDKLSEGFSIIETMTIDKPILQFIQTISETTDKQIFGILKNFLSSNLPFYLTKNENELNAMNEYRNKLKREFVEAKQTKNVKKALAAKEGGQETCKKMMKQNRIVAEKLRNSKERIELRGLFNKLVKFDEKRFDCEKTEKAGESDIENLKRSFKDLVGKSNLRISDLKAENKIKMGLIKKLPPKSMLTIEESIKLELDRMNNVFENKIGIISNQKEIDSEEDKK